MPKIYKIIGPPGTGKTEYLMRQIERACDKYFPKQLGVVSYTVASVSEAKNRIKKKLNIDWKDIPNVRTIHSHCFDLLGVKKENVMETAKNIRAFNECYPSYRLSVGLKDDEGMDPVGANDQIFNQMQTLRSKMVPSDQWPLECQSLLKSWSEYMESEGKVDFNGMLEQCLDRELSPNIRVLMVDEAQDLPALQIALIEQWGKQCDTVLYAGDGNQCQPPGSMILTSCGYKTIEDIEPDIDKLIAYAKCDAYFYGVQRNSFSYKNPPGYNFTKTVRPYNGTMYKIYVGNRTAQSTGNHIWQAKWKRETRTQDINVVYMMQQGARFRVGWCQLFNSVGVLHLRTRQTGEKAEKTWILGVFNNKLDASIMESYYSTQYGLPVITFEGINNSNYYTQEGIGKFFSMLDEQEQKKRAIELLNTLDLDYRYPLITSRSKKISASSSIFKVRSCNLIPDLMELPIYNGKPKVAWDSIGRIEKSQYSGPVYSLEVEKYHTYVTDGIATHNCMFRFAGSDPDNFINLKADKVIALQQSYRLSPAVLQKSIEIIRQANIKELVDFRATDKYGEGQVLSVREPDLSLPGTHMILCRCQFQVKRYVAALRKANIPFCNQYRKEDKTWNPLELDGAESVRIYLRLLKGEELDIYEIKQMIKNCVAKACMVRGAKKKIEGLPLTEKKKYEFFGLLGMGFLGTFLEKQGTVQDYFKINAEGKDLVYHLAENMPDQFFETPRICVSTYHGVKGGEADHAWIDPSITNKIKGGINNEDDAWDDECRCAYVACTRARKTVGILPTKGYRNPFL